MTLKQLWSILRGQKTNFTCLNASWTYYPDGDPMGKGGQPQRMETMADQLRALHNTLSLTELGRLFMAMHPEIFDHSERGDP